MGIVAEAGGSGGTVTVLQDVDVANAHQGFAVITFAIALQFGAVDKEYHVRRLLQYPGVAEVAQLVLVVVVALLNLAVHLC